VTILIRDATPDDVDAIARVHVQGWREAYMGLLPKDALAGLSVEERAATWRGIFARSVEGSKFLVAETGDGTVTGFACGGPARSQGEVPLGAEAEVYAIYLAESIKRQGVGRKLIRGIFNHLRANGFASVCLWVLKDNVAARRFYEKLGGLPGLEQPIVLRGETVTEISYRFDPIPNL
jgi:ribosomal protein S18 acetylase RimI-like enzyme